MKGNNYAPVNLTC